MTSQAHSNQPPVQVFTMTTAEWKDAVRLALEKLGLTYEQLADEAKKNDFSSLEARKLWVTIGDKKPRPGGANT